MRSSIAFSIFACAALGGLATFLACGSDDSGAKAGPSEAGAGGDGNGTIVGSGEDTGAPGPDAVVPNDVHGRVMDFTQAPSSGVTIVIKGKAPTTTAADGTFTVTDVAPPYDLLMVDATRHLGVAYLGLRRLDPVVFTNQVRPRKNARVNALLSSMPEFQPANQTVSMVFGSAEATGSASYTGPSQDVNPRAIPSVHWDNGAASTQGTMHVLQYQQDAGNPISYVRYGKSPSVTLTEGADAGTTFAMAAASSSRLTGTVNMQAGYQINGVQLSAVMGPNAELEVGGLTGFISNQISLATPDIGGTMKLTVLTAKGNDQSIVTTRGLAPNASGVTVTVPAAPSAISPADATTGVTNATQFTWSGAPNAVHVVTFYSFGGAFLGYFQVVTTGTTATIPDTSAYGLALPKNEVMEWAVRAQGPLASIDDYATAPPATPPAIENVGIANAIQFTTAP